LKRFTNRIKKKNFFPVLKNVLLACPRFSFPSFIFGRISMSNSLQSFSYASKKNMREMIFSLPDCLFFSLLLLLFFLIKKELGHVLRCYLFFLFPFFVSHSPV